jgi:hypothetical protein
MALQEAAEAYLVSLFEDTNLAAIHAKRESSRLHTCMVLILRCRCYYPAQGPRPCPSSPWRTCLSCRRRLTSTLSLCRLTPLVPSYESDRICYDYAIAWLLLKADVKYGLYYVCPRTTTAKTSTPKGHRDQLYRDDSKPTLELREELITSPHGESRQGCCCSTDVTGSCHGQTRALTWSMGEIDETRGIRARAEQITKGNGGANSLTLTNSGAERTKDRRQQKNPFLRS